MLEVLQLMTGATMKKIAILIVFLVSLFSYSISSAANPLLTQKGEKSPAPVTANTVYLLGGGNSTGVLKDVWKSNDVINNSWKQLTNNVPWVLSNAITPKGVYFDRKLWVIAGHGNNVLPVVSYSSDGINWTNTPTPPWAKRDTFAAAVFNDGGGEAIYVIGGQNGTTWYHDIWKTYDGFNWVQVTNNAPWGTISYHNLLSFKGELWLVGGSSYASYSDELVIWHSADGTNWTSIPILNVGRRNLSSAVVFDNKMWILGGLTYSTGPSNEVWYSENGISWFKAAKTIPWKPRHYHSSFVFDNKMWVTAGIIWPSTLNDVWYSENGGEWSPANPLQASWSQRGMQTVITTTERSPVGVTGNDSI